MTKLNWDAEGSRLFNTGIDRGVLYLEDGTGIVWNGLTSVTESPSETSLKSRYFEGVKYQTKSGNMEYNGSIEAYTYPMEFEEYDGTLNDNGFVAYHQKRKPFGLSYRTIKGNDTAGEEHGHEIHILYNVLAEPSSRDYETLSDDLDPTMFSWDFTTMPLRILADPEFTPSSHVIIDTTKMYDTERRFIEEYLYGSDDQDPRIPTIDELIWWFENPLVTLVIKPNTSAAASPTIESTTVNGDLRGRTSEGKYVLADNSRLVETAPGSGLYRLGT
ncbi:major tail protein [Arthrobacter phage Sloopyjoe]|nr:major tail protein [Arthrobacter phage Stayer]QFG09728.1 major tail protein [Arthrobacter phage Shiba]QFG10163.1 major tail protein [Arthrobacter phage Egad]QFG11733.1 major tail protein [Arthrobacter phage Salk]QFG12616.1 major tail protein [Arthrobacter phage Michelle]QFG14389.1 major tail protein [Arthrobacter phage StarLord]UVT31097.1 major tail protein [Arthrobacter phage Linda]WAB09435.1 major tail protein [Arthrobacter phage Sloopyjoe]WKW85737.1 major tail protein [Arthrobacter ph